SRTAWTTWRPSVSGAITRLTGIAKNIPPRESRDAVKAACPVWGERGERPQWSDSCMALSSLLHGRIILIRWSISWNRRPPYRRFSFGGAWKAYMPQRPLGSINRPKTGRVPVSFRVLTGVEFCLVRPAYRESLLNQGQQLWVIAFPDQAAAEEFASTYSQLVDHHLDRRSNP